MQENQVFTVEISNGWNKIFWYRKFFREQGFSFQKKAYGKSYYYIKIKNQEVCQKYKEFCRFRGLKCQIYEKEYVRSHDYRKVFLSTKNYTRKYTLCAYCGLPARVSQITVDHIIPVDKAKKTVTGRFLMKIFKIQNINEYKNLCGAHKSCNSRKGRKMGLWILRGFIGKNIPLWYVRWVIRALAICIIFYIAIFI